MTFSDREGAGCDGRHALAALAAALGVAWIAARVWYMVGYTQAAEKRGPGFGLPALVCAVLLVGALAGIINSFLHGG